MTEFFEKTIANPVNLTAAIISLIALGCAVAFALVSPKLCWLILKNLRRNLLRPISPGPATMALALMVRRIWTVSAFIAPQTGESPKDINLSVPEACQLRSQFPPAYARYLNPEDSSFLP